MKPDSPNWPDQMLNLIREVSDELPDEAEDLFRDDTSSLDRYIGSEAFMEDLLSAEQPLDVDVETFFAILFRQFHRRLNEDDQFRSRFHEEIDQLPTQNWSVDETRTFFRDEALINYLVDMLKGFLKTDDVYQLPGEEDEEYRYIVDMLDVAVDASDVETFQIFCHIGNYSLYLTGVFPDWVEHRHEYKKRPMDVDSYRNYGKTYFERAAAHDMAQKRDLKPVLTKLHSGYDLVSTTLNVMFTELTPAFDR